MSTPPIAPPAGTGLPPGADPQVEAAVAEQQQAVAAAAAVAATGVVALWAGLDAEDPFGWWFSGAHDKAFVLVSMAQEAAAATARRYVVDSTAAQGLVVAVPDVDPLAFAGRNADGRDLEGLLLQAVVHTAASLNAGLEPATAAARGEMFLRTVIASQVADAAREATQALVTAAEVVQIDPDLLDGEHTSELEAEVYRQVDDDVAARRLMADLERIINEAAANEVVRDAERFTRNAAREWERSGRGKKAAPKIGWIRVLTPPSCGRCALLAGKWYGWNDGFERHPLCDCIHLPTTLAASQTYSTNPQRYFESLSPADQDALFGASQAQAIRDGADISQVVNATATGGMYTAQGRQFTTSGTTKRGAYRKSSEAGKAKQARITPLQIYKDAGGDREAAVAMLRRYGYITD